MTDFLNLRQNLEASFLIFWPYRELHLTRLATHSTTTQRRIIPVMKIPTIYCFTQKCAIKRSDLILTTVWLCDWVSEKQRYRITRHPHRIQEWYSLRPWQICLNCLIMWSPNFRTNESWQVYEKIKRRLKYKGNLWDINPQNYPYCLKRENVPLCWKLC